MGGEKIFSGKRALVVGGSGGIGKTLALGLAARGACVTITGGNSRERLEAALAELNVFGRDNTGFLCRIGGAGGEQYSTGLSPEDAVSFILEKAGMPDILVIAWGPFKKALLAETTSKDWKYLTESNLIFPGIMISSVLYSMILKEWGRILLFGGTKTAEVRGFLETAAYSTVKTALGTLAKSAAKCGAGKGVSCNVICPGLIGTEYIDPEELEWYNKQNPGGKALKPEEIAGFALEILENPAINGAVIPADGGLWL